MLPEGAAQRHGMNGHLTVRKLQVEHFKEITSRIRPDTEAFGWLVAGFDVEESQGMRPSVANLAGRNAVAVGRPPNLHSAYVMENI